MANGNQQYYYQYGGQWMPWENLNRRFTENYGGGQGGGYRYYDPGATYYPYYMEGGQYYPAAYNVGESGRITPLGTSFPSAETPPSPTFNYPTPEQVWSTVYGLEPMSMQRNILMQGATPQAYEATLRPYMENVMRGLGRSGLPSSSMADRIISQTLGQQWQAYQTQQRAGWENLARAAAAMGTYWYAPYESMLSRVTA